MIAPADIPLARNMRDTGEDRALALLDTLAAQIITKARATGGSQGGYTGGLIDGVELLVETVRTQVAINRGGGAGAP